MPRRDVVTITDIQRRRATSWEMHYRNRNLARQIAMQMQDPMRVIRTIQRHVPAPTIEFDGYLYRPLDVIVGEAQAAQELGFPHTHKALMCLWYWSDTGWDEFVRAYQGLLEVTEDHYWTYDAERDGAILTPLSAKPLRADARYNLGTTQVQPNKIMYKSEIEG